VIAPTDLDPLESTIPRGLGGVEPIEYATAGPLALGRVLERTGGSLVARHRSRELLLYRQGTMGVVIELTIPAIVRSPCESFYLHHLESGDAPAAQSAERPVRVGLGAPDVLEATPALRGRGVEFIAPGGERPIGRGGPTRGVRSGVWFELVAAPTRAP